MSSSTYCADDFYFALDRRGARMFYSRRTGARICMGKIPKDIFHQVKQSYPGYRNIDLIKQKEDLLAKIKELHSRIEYIDICINKGSQPDKTEEIKERELRDASIAREAKAKADHNEYMEKFLKEQARIAKEAKDKAQANEKAKEDKRKSMGVGDLLLDNGITCKKDLNKWLLVHHPDKDPKGDLDLCQRVITAATMRYGK